MNRGVWDVTVFTFLPRRLHASRLSTPLSPFLLREREKLKGGNSCSQVAINCETHSRWVTSFMSRHTICLLSYKRCWKVERKRIIIYMLKKFRMRAWRDGATVKNICCSCRDTGSSSQHSRGSSKLLIFPVLGNAMPLSGLLGQHTHVQAKLSKN